MSSARFELAWRGLSALHRRMRVRLLRTYERMANKDHHCSHCPSLIEPGDWYHAEVKAIDNPVGFSEKRSIIQVHKWHDSCPPDPYDDDRLDDQEDMEVPEFHRNAA